MGLRDTIDSLIDNSAYAKTKRAVSGAIDRLPSRDTLERVGSNAIDSARQIGSRLVDTAKQAISDLPSAEQAESAIHDSVAKAKYALNINQGWDNGYIDDPEGRDEALMQHGAAHAIRHLTMPEGDVPQRLPQGNTVHVPQTNRGAGQYMPSTIERLLGR